MKHDVQLPPPKVARRRRVNSNDLEVPSGDNMYEESATNEERGGFDASEDDVGDAPRAKRARSQ